MNKSSNSTALRNLAFRWLRIATVIPGTGVVLAIRRKIIKNEYQEDRAPKGSLILIAPGANLVAILRPIDHNPLTPGAIDERRIIGKAPL